MTFKCLELLLVAGSDFMSLFKRFFIIFCLFLVSQFCIFAGGRKTDSGKKGKLDFANLLIVNPDKADDSFYYLGKLKVEDLSVNNWTKNVVLKPYVLGNENEGPVLPALVVGLIAETFASEQNKLLIKDMYKNNPSIFKL